MINNTCLLDCVRDDNEVDEEAAAEIRLDWIGLDWNSRGVEWSGEKKWMKEPTMSTMLLAEHHPLLSEKENKKYYYMSCGCRWTWHHDWILVGERITGSLFW